MATAILITFFVGWACGFLFIPLMDYNTGAKVRNYVKKMKWW